jgi:hypothetical protein
MDTHNLHGHALGIMVWQKNSARLAAVVLLVAACRGASVTGGWGSQVDPTTGRLARLLDHSVHGLATEIAEAERISKSYVSRLL